MRKTTGLVLLFAILCLLIISFRCSPSGSTKPVQSAVEPVATPPLTTELTPVKVNTGLLGQNLDSLKDLNGKIVALEALQIQTTCTDKPEIYKIRYLSDGLEVVGFLVRPKQNATASPVLIYNRGGSLEFGKIDNAALIWLSSLACRYGYVVVASQYRGNDGGQGREQYGGNDVDDVLNLLPLAKSLPFTSPTNIAMLGISRGGMMTYLALGKTNDIKAAVIVSGLADCMQNYNEREQAMKQVYIDLVGGTPSEKGNEFKMRSVVYWPEKINTPLLILHGDNDWRVNVSQAKDLGDKLKALGKTYDLVIYPGGSHGLSENWKDRDDRTFKWFAKYIQLPLPMPWER